MEGKGGIPSVPKAKRILMNKGQGWINVLIGSGLKNKETGWLKQQQFIFSQFWRLEVQDQSERLVGGSFNLFPAGQLCPPVQHLILKGMLLYSLLDLSL